MESNMFYGLLDVDGHNGFPNLALMKIARYYHGRVEWAMPLFGQYDTIFASKVFTFSPEPNWNEFNYRTLEKGGTGYDIGKKLPKEIDAIRNPDYSIYPNCNYSIQFYSRGCIRNCGFCLVRHKEGKIHPVEPMELNPKGEWIEVLDNNFFANPEWRSAIEDLKRRNMLVKFHGVDIRIMTDEMAFALNELKLHHGIHIAWDNPKDDLRPQIKELTKYISPEKVRCYVLIGYNSTREEDYIRLRYLKELNVLPFVQPYRDYDCKREPTQYERDIQRYANRNRIFTTVDFFDYAPREGVKGSDYFDADFIKKWKVPVAEIVKVKERTLFD